MNTIHFISMLLLVLLLPTGLFACWVRMFLTCDELIEMGICVERTDDRVEGRAA